MEEDGESQEAAALPTVRPITRQSSVAQEPKRTAP